MPKTNKKGIIYISLLPDKRIINISPYMGYQFKRASVPMVFGKKDI